MLLNKRIASISGVCVTTWKITNADDGDVQLLLPLVVTKTKPKATQMVLWVVTAVLFFWYERTLVQIRV